MTRGSGTISQMRSLSTMRSMPMIWLIILTACGGASTSDASPSPDAPTGVQSARALGSVDGAAMGYLEYLPPGYGDGDPRPLLVFLHGRDEAGDGSEAELGLVDKNGVPALIASGHWPHDLPFTVLSPQYQVGPANNGCGIGEDIAAFLDFAMDRYEVDPARVYLTGLSCGAIGSWDYFADHGDEVVAAAVLISGHPERALEKAGCAPLTEVPVWAFHGALDNIVPTIRVEGPIAEIQACEGTGAIELELTVYPNADHDAWTRTYDLTAGHDIYAWMLEHTNESAQAD